MKRNVLIVLISIAALIWLALFFNAVSQDDSTITNQADPGLKLIAYNPPVEDSMAQMAQAHIPNNIDGETLYARDSYAVVLEEDKDDGVLCFYKHKTLVSSIILPEYIPMESPHYGGLVPDIYPGEDGFLAVCTMRRNDLIEEENERFWRNTIVCTNYVFYNVSNDSCQLIKATPSGFVEYSNIPNSFQIDHGVYVKIDEKQVYLPVSFHNPTEIGGIYSSDDIEIVRGPNDHSLSVYSFGKLITHDEVFPNDAYCNGYIDLDSDRVCLLYIDANDNSHYNIIYSRRTNSFSIEK